MYVKISHVPIRVKALSVHCVSICDSCWFILGILNIIAFIVNILFILLDTLNYLLNFHRGSILALIVLS
jgi:hypothetical protein